MTNLCANFEHLSFGFNIGANGTSLRASLCSRPGERSRGGAGSRAAPYAGLSPDKQLLIPSGAPSDECEGLGSFPKLTSVGGAFKIPQVKR